MAKMIMKLEKLIEEVSPPMMVLLGCVISTYFIIALPF